MQNLAMRFPRLSHEFGRAYNATRQTNGERPMSTQEETVRAGRQDEASRDYPPPYFTDRRKPQRVFDATINVPTILAMLSMVVATVGFGITIYLSFDKRLATLEESDRQQEAHFTRLENENREFKSDTRQTLNDINTTVRQVRDWMLSEGRVANRPEAGRWTRSN